MKQGRVTTWHSFGIGILLILAFGFLMSSLPAGAALPLAITSSSSATIEAGAAQDLNFNFTATSTMAVLGDVITLSVPTTFGGQAAIAMADIDFLVNSTQQALVGACGVATDFIFTKTLVASDYEYRFEACGGGLVTIGDVVDIRIGTNAVFGGAGATNMTMPAAGVYTVSYFGQAGSGTGQIGLGGPSAVSVGATVATTTPIPPGGGGGGGGGEPTLVITNVQAQVIDANTAIITWNTNYAASSRVDYGLATTLADTVSSGSYVTSHSETLTGLQPGSLYYFRVEGSTATALFAQSTISTFTTPVSGGPTITDIQAINVTETTADIVFYTDQLAGYVLDYGPGGYSFSVSDPTLADSFLVPLTGLTPDTSYSVRVIVENALGMQSPYAYVAFVTLPPGAPQGVLNFWGERTMAGSQLYWEYPAIPNQGVELYRFDGLGPVDTSTLLNPPIYQGSLDQFFDGTVEPTNDYTYCIALIDLDGDRSPMPCISFPGMLGPEITIKVMPELRRNSQAGNALPVFATIRPLTANDPQNQVSVQTNLEGIGTFTLLQNIYGDIRIGSKGLSHLRQAREQADLVYPTPYYIDYSEGDTVIALAGDTYRANTDLFAADPDNLVNALDVSVTILDLSLDEIISDFNVDHIANAIDLSALIRNLSVWGEAL